MKLLKSIAISVFLLAPMVANAAPFLIYEAEGSGLIEDGFGAFFDLDGDEIDVAVNGMQDGGTLIADLLVSRLDGGALLSSSNLVDSMLTVNPVVEDTNTQDVLTLVFGSLSGEDVALFGSTATVEFSFFEETVEDGFFTPVGVRIYSDVAPIPLPASLPMLAAGLLVVAGLRRRRR